MELKEIITHRFRDLDSVIRADKKFRLGVFVFMRQIFKLLRLNESGLKNLVRDNTLFLDGKKFYTRKNTLDFLFFSKYYEPQTTKFLKENMGKTFIDVGSHIGRFAVLMSEKFDNVYAIEPHPNNFKYLKKNIGLNRLKNVIPINCAVSNSKKDLFIDNLEMNTGAAKIKSQGENKVKCQKLDYLINQHKINLGKSSVILIDVEGHELEVLEGGKRALSSSNPTLIIESFNPKSITDFLSRYGYHLKSTLDHYNHVFIKSKNI